MTPRKNYVITTDDPLMNLIGLGSFTLDKLEKWLQSKQNTQYIAATRSLDTEDIIAVRRVIPSILYGTYSGNDINPKFFEFTNYRRYGLEETYTGVVITGSQNSWTYTLAGLNYSAADIEINGDDINPDVNEEEEYSDNRIVRAIRMNNLVNDPNNDESDARKKFIRDIKTSKEGGIEWASKIYVYADKDTICEKDVIFKIKLYDAQGPAPQAFNISIPEPRFTDVRRNVVGTPYVSRDENERLTPVLDDEPSSKVGAKLDIHYNEYTKKFESGTKTMLAVLTTDLPAATLPEEGALANPTEYTQSNNKGLQPTYGKARPLTMKSGNFRRWGPEWKYTDGCTDAEKEEIQEVPVQNKLGVAFSRGQRVLLHQIDGVWQPTIPAGSEESTTATVGVTNWSFMYLISNVNYFFRDTTGTRFTYETYEDAFYDYYYGNTSSSTGVLNQATAGYVQLTSWDFMGTQVGGNRTNHALCNTQFYKRADGEVAEDAVEANSATTAPFFGCVFADGYDTGASFNEYTEGTTQEMVAWHPGGYMVNILEGVKIIDSTNGDNINGSIFQDVANGDTTLHQLPADIATNQAPTHSGVGNPVPILERMDHYLNTVNYPGQLNFQNACRDYLGQENYNRYAWLSVIDNDDNSTFEYTPRNPKVLEFRPLKAEVLAALDIDSLVEKTTDVNQRASFATQAWNQVGNNTYPLSPQVRGRQGTDGVLSTKGFRFANDLHNSVYLSNTSSAFPFEYWNQDWTEDGSSNPRPGGAFGIVGASCTVTANTSITFAVQCNFGMDDTFSAGGIFQGDWTSSFGGDNNTYYSRNNSALHVRIYHAWPKELTVYDPRFFAVHHFAPGVLNSDPTETIANEDDTEIGYPDNKYIIQDKGSSITDFRVPTKIGSGAEQEQGVIADVGDNVYANEDVDPVWRDPTHWQVRTAGRGKLLPFTGQVETVSVGAVSFDEQGSDYAIGNTFTTSAGAGSGVIVRVATTGANGTVGTLEIIDGGKNFRPADFFKESELGEADYTSAKLKLIDLDANGEGFKGFCTYGVVALTNENIAKPQRATSDTDFKLSVQPPIPDTNAESITRSINESKTSVATISNKSSDNQYDCFFHYYNDVSHCFMSSWGFSPRTIEQQMELEITPV